MITKTEAALCAGIFCLGAAMLTGAMPPEGKTAVCRNNLARLSQAVHAYAQDNGGFLPPLIVRKRTWEFWMSRVLPYARDAHLFYCPANPRSEKILSDEGPGERDLLPSVFDIGSTAYGMNTYLSSDGSPKSRWRKLSEAASPAYTISLGDSAVKRGYSLRPVRVCWPSDYGPFHEGASSNYALLDGHVENFTKDTLGLAEAFDGWKKDIQRWKNWKNQP